MNDIRTQGFRFVVVGLISNSLLFAGYITLTALGLDPKGAMTLLYVIGITQTFVLNKYWTFSDRRLLGLSLWRYLFVYAGVYGLNLILLHMFVDNLRWPHQTVQGVAIIALAVVLFLAQRYWVFSGRQKTHDI